MHHNVPIHHLQMLLHASVVDLFSPVQHINERNDLSKATSYFYMESEIALWRNTALSASVFVLLWAPTTRCLWPGIVLVPSWWLFLGNLVQMSTHFDYDSWTWEVTFGKCDHEYGVWKSGHWPLLLWVNVYWAIRCLPATTHAPTFSKVTFTTYINEYIYFVHLPTCLFDLCLPHGGDI